MLDDLVQQSEARGVVMCVRKYGLAEDVHGQAIFATRYPLGRIRPVGEAGTPAAA
ncbi:hypothetical protein [Streptomyces sp. CB02400]|uniref:hypothetical protein n=1 Tax=unclassified Streptomyces TaxID=2593676 RepID=UPI001F299919|nr:hypothetical protein [Streptomyces sp. CB02400]